MPKKRERYKKRNSGQSAKQKAERPIKRLSKEKKEEYNRLRTNAMKKVSRIRNQLGYDVYYEEQGLQFGRIDAVKTYEDLERRMQQFREFTDRSNLRYQYAKNQHGIVVNQKLLSEANKYTKQAQEVAERRIEEIKKLPYMVRGETVSSVEEQIRMSGRPQNYTGIYVPENFNFDRYHDPKDIEKYVERMKNKSDVDYYNERLHRMKENWMFIVSQTFNSDADGVVDYVRSMSDDDFYEMYLSMDEFSFDYYDSEGAEWARDMDKLEQLKMYLHEHSEGEVNFDLKDFPIR